MTVEVSMTDAPAFIAALIPTGVTFEAKQGVRNPEYMFITFTGGY